MPRSTRKRRDKKGGKVIAQGSYGCVFNPPLPCTGSGRPSGDMVSKLMESSDAEKEYEELIRFSGELKKIPGYHRYFLIEPIEVCPPAEIDYADEFKGASCDIATADEVESNPGRYAIIQMPNGGMEVSKYLSQGMYNNEQTFAHVVSSMVQLLDNAIVELNKNGLYHLDVKGPNIVVGSDGQARLIDWGFTFFPGQPVEDASARGGEAGTQDGMYAFEMFNSPPAASMIYHTAVPPSEDDHGRKWSGEETGRVRDTWEAYMKSGSSNDRKRVIDTYLRSAHGRFLVNDILGPAAAVYATTADNLLSQYVSIIRKAYSDRNGGFDHDDFYRDFYHNADQWGWATAFSPLTKGQPGLSGEAASSARFGAAGLIVYIMTKGAVRISTKELSDLAMTMTSPAVLPTRTRRTKSNAGAVTRRRKKTRKHGQRARK